MKRNWYQIKAEGTGPAIVYLYGTIGQDWWGDGNSALDFAKALDELSPRDIELRINSGGGDVFEGYAIYSAIKRYAGQVTSYNDGLAASAASFIALAADEYVPAEASFTMIHKAWSFALGNADELRITADKLDAIDEQLVGIYDRNSIKDVEEIRAAMAVETWLTAADCVEWGFASRIEAGLKAAASVSKDMAKAFEHIPEAVCVVDTDTDPHPPIGVVGFSDAAPIIPIIEDAPNAGLEQEPETDEGQEPPAMRTVALASGVYTFPRKKA